MSYVWFEEPDYKYSRLTADVVEHYAEDTTDNPTSDQHPDTYMSDDESFAIYFFANKWK